MIEWQLVVAGIAIGVAVAAPVGPINIMCIQRSLKQGFKAGLITGVGAVLGDGLFAAIAAFSITSISTVIIENSQWIEVAGGVFLIGLGVRGFLAQTTLKPAPETLGLTGNTALVGTTFFMTITNPAMILGFAAFFGSAGNLVRLPQDYFTAAVLVAAVMAGSLLWWVFLAGVMHRFRTSIGAKAIATVNRISGFVIALFGFVVLLRVIIAEFYRW